MKILYYNWVTFKDPFQKGGGVSHYLKNVLKPMALEHEVVFLSSGNVYDVFNPQVRYELRSDNGCCKTFELINSTCPAPAHVSFGSPSQINSAAVSDVFFQFLEEIGGVDIIHFNNIEGIPVSLLGLKKRFPSIKIVVTLHNYYPFCPQVNLYYQEKSRCTDFLNGKACVQCITPVTDSFISRIATYTQYQMEKNSFLTLSDATSVCWKLLKKIRSVLPYSQKKENTFQKDPTLCSQWEHFQYRRKAMVSSLNEHCDMILAVSERVKQIAVDFGVTPDIVRTCYVGTTFADQFGKRVPKTLRRNSRRRLKLVYLGYMRKDKGFYFLLDALKSLESDLASRLEIVVAARNTDNAAVRSLRELRSKYASIKYIDGYSHTALPHIIRDADVGIVPVLWEDNLPQVAIEMHCHNLPILTSDLGGAQELHRNKMFTFKHGDIEDFHQKIRALTSNEVSLETYWKNSLRPLSNKEHCRELCQIYSTLAAC